MPAPVNYSHLTLENISDGRKNHITLDEMNKLVNGETTTFTYVSTIDFSGERYKTKTVTVVSGLITNVSAESDWI